MKKELELQAIKSAIESWTYRLNGGTYWWEKEIYSKEHILSQIAYFTEKLKTNKP